MQQNKSWNKFDNSNFRDHESSIFFIYSNDLPEERRSERNRYYL